MKHKFCIQIVTLIYERKIPMKTLLSHQFDSGNSHPPSPAVHISTWLIWVGIIVLLIMALSAVAPDAVVKGALALGGNSSPLMAAGSPVLINYQGQLTDAGGVPQGNITVDMRFKIYTQETGGNYDWMETHLNVPTDDDGRFNVILNSTGLASGDLASLLRTQSDLWLEVEVNAQVLSPRERITSVGFALSAPWSGLTGMPADFADGADDIGLAGTGLNLNSGIFEIAGGYRLPVSCSNGQVAKWNNTVLAWECADDNASSTSYTAGNGLVLNGAEFSVVYGGNGSAKSVARSDHTHTSQTWSATGPTGLQINNSSAVSGAFALYGNSTGSNDNFGVKGRTSSNVLGAKGVYGYASAANGTVYGVYGEAASPQGYGVYSQGNAYVNGNLGVSSNMGVSGDLDVSSDLNVGGTLNLATAATRDLSIPPAAFIPVKNDIAYDVIGYLKNKEGGICNSQKLFVAPLFLPQNATIASLTEFVYNANAGVWDDRSSSCCNVIVRIWRIDLYNGSIDQLATIQMSGSVPYQTFAHFTTTSVASSVVDNVSYAFYVEASLPGTGCEFNLLGVVVSYQVSVLP